SATEGNSGNTPAGFKIVLNRPSEYDAQVNYKTADGTAKAGSDYVATSGTLTIKAGKTSKSVVVNVIGDNVRERNENFALVLNNPVNAVLGTPDSSTCTIKNDDPSFALIAGASNSSEINKTSSIKIVPNPVQDILSIQALDADHKTSLSIIDLDGRPMA